MASVSLEAYPEFLTVRQYASLTNTNARTVQRMCALGRLSAQKLPGTNSWRIRKESLQNWLNGFSHLDEKEVARG